MLLVTPPPAARWVRQRLSLGWGVRIPFTLRVQFEEDGRLWLLANLGFVLGAVLLWMRARGVPGSEIGLAVNNWLQLFLAGVAGGAFLAACRVAYVKLIPPCRSDLLAPLSRGPLSIWVLTFLVGGLAEESWRAVCLRTFQGNDHRTILWIFLTSIAFVVGRLSGFPARASGSHPEVFWKALHGGILAGYFLAFGTLWVPYIAGLAHDVTNLFTLRRLARAVGSTPDPVEFDSTGLDRKKWATDDALVVAPDHIPARCPSCRSVLSLGLQQREGAPFLCPECGESIYVAPRGSIAGNIIISCVFGYGGTLLVGLRGMALGVAGLLWSGLAFIIFHAIVHLPPVGPLHVLREGHPGSARSDIAIRDEKRKGQSVVHLRRGVARFWKG